MRCRTHLPAVASLCALVIALVSLQEAAGQAHQEAMAQEAAHQEAALQAQQQAAEAAATQNAHQGGQLACGVAMQIPKIALMFLSRAGMPLAPVWEHWLQPLAGLAPAAAVQTALCSGSQVAHSCALEQGGSALQRQAMFSFYVHSSLVNFTGFAPDDVFYGTLIQDLTKAVWGDTSVAVRSLMRNALKDPLNQRFVLLSDTDVPIYPARVIYAQLMSEQLSRIAACQAYDMSNINRYTCKMSEDGIHIHHWRKNSLWFALTRPHAEMLAGEEEIRQSFQEHCSGVLYDKTVARYRGCLVDEHYYGTVFAKLGRTHETDCKGIVSISDISRSVRGHPKMYTPQEIDFNLVGKIRFPIQFLGRAHCANDTLWQNAKDQFLALPEAIAHHSAQQCALYQQIQPYVPMESWCQLFGRKFRGDTSQAILAAFPGQDPRWSLQ